MEELRKFTSPYLPPKKKDTIMLSKFMFSFLSLCSATPELPDFLNYPPEGQQFRTQTLSFTLL